MCYVPTPVVAADYTIVVPPGCELVLVERLNARVRRKFGEDPTPHLQAAKLLWHGEPGGQPGQKTYVRRRYGKHALPGFRGVTLMAWEDAIDALSLQAPADLGELHLRLVKGLRELRPRYKTFDVGVTETIVAHGQSSIPRFVTLTPRGAPRWPSRPRSPTPGTCTSSPPRRSPCDIRMDMV
jgi:hypothetical protein